MTGTRTTTKKKYRRIARDVAKGVPFGEVMARNKASRRTVFTAMQRHGVVRGHSSNGSVLRVLAQIVLASPVARKRGPRRLKHSMREIADQLGSVSRQRVHQVFTEAKALGLLHPDLTAKND